MKKILIFGISLLVLLGCVSKQKLPQEEPNQKEIMKDEQLYKLLSSTMEEQNLLDPLLDKPGGYVFSASGNFQILISNNTKRIEIELLRGYPNKSTTVFEVSDQVFSYVLNGARKEGVFSFWLTENQVFVSVSDIDHYGFTLSYHDENFELLEYYALPAIKSIDEFPPAMIDALERAVKENLLEYDSQIQAMHHVVEVLQNTMNQNTTEFVMGTHSSYATSTQEYNRMLEDMMDTKENQCTYIPIADPVKQDVLYQTASVIDVGAKDFLNPSEAVVNANMASNMLLLSEVYYHHDGSFVSSYTEKEVEGFSVPQEIQGNRYYYGIGFYDRYASVQQQLFPGSLPFALSEDVKVFGYTQLGLYKDYVLFDIPEGDGPTSRRNEMLILSMEEIRDTIVVEVVFFNSFNQFMKDKEGNTYRYSNCKESDLFFESILSRNIEKFERRKITLRNQGNQYFEFVSLETLQ